MDSKIFRINKLAKMKQTRGHCEVCDNRGTDIHHIDGNRDNNGLDNLSLLCRPCHRALHFGGDHKAKKTSKFIRLYGATAAELSRKYGGSVSLYSNLHRHGELRDWLKNREPVR